MGILGAASASAFFDDFNRDDSSTLGPNWTLVNGGECVRSNQAAGAAYGTNMALANGVGLSYLNAYATLDVFAGGTSLQYDAIGLGMTADASEGIFVKVQESEGGGAFDTAGFYRGNNNSGEAWGPGFFFLPTSFQSARISVFALNADTIRLGIDTNFDGTFEQVYDSSGVLGFASSLGTGVGLGQYGPDSRADNFSATTVSSVPGPAALAPFAIGLLALRRRRR